MAQKLLHYDVLERLGEGARSTIYLVQDPTTKQLFALKHVHRDTQKDIRFIEQMEIEFEISRQFTHPNLRRTYDLKIQKSLLLKVNEAYMVMEFVDGKPLDVFLPPGMMEILDTFIQAAQGLKAMHSMGYAHCDIKPNNILYCPSGKVKVIDFGQSCKIGTIKERIQGTPDYIAPEQVKCLPVSLRTDIYNFGATMYWALCGRKMPTLFNIKRDDNSILCDDLIPAPKQLNPLLPETLSNFVMECTRLDPQKRPADMAEVGRRLEIIQHAATRQMDARNSNVA